LIAGAAAVIPHPVVVYNPTPSIPLGYYFRSGEAPAKGKIIAFPVPELGREYANAHAAYLVRGSIIKPIVAVAGDTVCTTGKEGLLINGKVIAPIIERDRNGVQLPHWRGCRQLTSGELFVFSDRIPNSFDSRYYGPVDASQIIGVFRIFWSVPDASEQQIVAKQLAAIW
jgi:conjugative transfer signal peptidase TraF